MLSASIVLLGFAAPLTVPVQWTAPAECPGQARAKALVQEELSATDPDQLEATGVRGTVSAVEAGYRLDVSIDLGDRSIERSVALDDCSGAAEALALVVAIAVEPPDELGPTMPEPPVPPVAQPEPANEVARPPMPELAPPVAAVDPTTIVDSPSAADPTVAADGRRSRWRPRVAIGVSSGVGLGVLGTGGQVGGGVAAVWRRARLGVGVEHWIRRRERLDGSPEVGADVSITEGRLEGGPVLGGPRFELSPTVFGGAGVVQARGRAPGGRTARVQWATAGVTVRGLWFPRRWIGVGAQAQLIVPLVRHTFVLTPSTVVVETGSIAGAIRANVEFRIL